MTGVDVAVNLLWCVTGRVGGSEEYLARQLAGLDPAIVDEGALSATLFVPRGYEAAHPALTARFDTVVAPLDGVSRARRIVAEHTWLAGRTRHADVVHHGGGTAPSIPGRLGPRIVLTVHDLQYETHPEYVAPHKLRYLRWAMPRSVARAAVVAVPTEYVRSTVVSRFDVEPERVVVVPHGVEPGSGADISDADTLRRRYALGDGPVVVYPAITHPHKGHVFLLEVLAEAWRDPDVRLVLLGGRGAADDEVAATVERLGLGDRVVRPGRVPEADRDGIVALADALAFPSEYEGFGAPAVEAMTLGTPVICSPQPALVEVVGDAGVVAERDVDAWAAALDTVGAERDRLVAAGLHRAAAFTSAVSGAALADAYRLAAVTDRSDSVEAAP